MLHLVLVELTEVAHIHIGLPGIYDSRESIELYLVIAEILDGNNYV